MLEKHLTDLIDYNFRGLIISVPRQFEDCLELLYGDWQTPVRYANYEMNKFAICKAKLKNELKNELPFKLRFFLLKLHHQKDLEKFLSKCESRGVNLKYEVKF